ncbi:hypothetical protein [Bosea vaviloviae]|uniref:Uncharacterized protein n=1 Tax=Bosea vaviloviae TaxID=1526658 RepID=A0A1D7U2Q3_9HYPH|nr:hypothetical protein [Bosea vaviloviae]AOO81666.1 hypothetical protein BHK69_15465 [Bosea vaviloviae]
MSVRLTLRLHCEQDYVIDCTAEGLQGVAIVLELADDVNGGGDTATLESNGPVHCQDEVIDTPVMADTGYAVEGQERGAIIDRKRGSLSALGRNFAQESYSEFTGFRQAG